MSIKTFNDLKDYIFSKAGEAIEYIKVGKKPYYSNTLTLSELESYWNSGYYISVGFKRHSKSVMDFTISYKPIDFSPYKFKGE